MCGVYHMVDTTKSRRSVMAVAKGFRTGRSQAIRLPKEFRVNSDTVHLKRTNEGSLVITTEPWEIFFESVDQLSDQFLGSDREQPELESRD
jgi:antitoxin VapB